MYKDIIKKYIENLKKEDIIKFINNNNYQVNNDDINTIYYYIKNYWEDFYSNNDLIWEKLKKDVSSSTYLEIIKLYQKYQKFIK